jgi:hypothetical protein
MARNSESQESGLDRRQLLGGAGALALAPWLPAGVGDVAARGVPDRPQWPVRTLLTPDLSQSLDRRNLAKVVHARRVLDDMESDGGWTPSGVVSLAYTTERARSGTRSLRMRTALRNEDYIARSRQANGTFSGQGVLFDGLPFSASITREFATPQDWSEYNRISLWCYVHPTSNPAISLSLQFLCAGASAGPTDPIAVHYFADLEPGRWNHLAWEIPEQRRDRVTRLVLFQPVAGVPVHDAETEVVYDFDELCVERVDAERVDGWEISATSIAYCHVGYAPAAAKIAVAAPGPEDFELIDSGSGNTVATLPARRAAGRRGSYSVLDFSAFNRPGTYRLRYGAAMTESFDVAAGAWRKVVEATLNAFYGLRCGCRVPGAHDACHLDVYCEYQGERRPLGGGWHDAANLTQGPYRTHLSIYALVELHDALRASGEAALAERALEEARWGLEWSLRMRFAPGLRTLYGAYSYFTDGVPGTADDVLQQDERSRVGRDAFQNSLAILATARAARSLGARDRALAARLLAAAREDYAVTAPDTRPPPEAHPLQINEPSWRDRIGYLTLAAVELHRATGNAGYAADAARFARWLIDTQERRFVDGIQVSGYFYEDAGRTRLVHEYHNSFEDSGLLALAGLCATQPDHPDWIEWYAGLAIYHRHYCQAGGAASAPFHVLPAAVWRRADLDAPIPADPTGERIARLGPSPLFPTPPTPELVREQMRQQYAAALELGPAHRLRIFPLWYDGVRHGASVVQLSKSIGLAAAAGILNSHDASELAARQLQWVLGANPFSRSLMFGVGHDYWQNFSVSLPNLVGGLSLGFNSLRDDAPAWGNNALFPYKEQWVYSSCRVAHLLAHVGTPARVTGAAPAGATFTNRRTGQMTQVSPGRFDLRLPGGEYRVRFGAWERQVSLADGAVRRLTLDPARTIMIELAEEAATGSGTRIALQVMGRGRHQLEARAYNARVAGLPGRVELRGTEPVRFELELTIEDRSGPWILCVVPDGRVEDRVVVDGRA